VLAPAFDPGVSICDVGSGAGLPGLVIAIARPDVQVTVMDSMARRVAFLDEAVGELGLPNVQVTRARAGESTVLEGMFGFVTARAVAPLEMLVRWCAPLLQPGGHLLAIKGQSAEDELTSAAGAIRRAGGGQVRIEEYGVGMVDPPTRVIRIEFAGRSAQGRPGR
jgi:16S rRNA (guanine527-N7)-methyltransferase